MRQKLDSTYADVDATIAGDVVYAGVSTTPVVFKTPQAARLWALDNVFAAHLGGRFPIFRKRARGWEPITKESFKDEMAACVVLVGEKTRPFYDWWWDNPAACRRYDGIEYAPPGEAPNLGYFNTWEGFSVSPKPGDWSLMQAHIKQIICGGDEVAYEYVVDWLAQAVQYAGRPGRTALVLQGGKGVGKGVFAKTVQTLFGRHGAYLNEVKQLTGEFNAQLENVSLLFADEMRLMHQETQGKFRAMLTESTIPIRRMRTDLYDAQNCLHVIIASNDDQVVWATTDERRFCILKVSPEKAKDPTWFGPLWAEQVKGGPGQAAMLYDLLHRDISEFNPEAFPKTAGFEEHVVASLTGTEAWLYEKLDEGSWGPGWTEWERMAKAKLLDIYKTDTGNSKLTSAKLSRFFVEVFGEHGFDHKQKSATGEREYRFPPLAACVAAFEKKYGVRLGSESAAAPDEPSAAEDWPEEEAPVLEFDPLSRVPDHMVKLWKRHVDLCVIRDPDRTWASWEVEAWVADNVDALE